MYISNVNMIRNITVDIIIYHPNNWVILSQLNQRSQAKHFDFDLIFLFWWKKYINEERQNIKFHECIFTE